MDKPILSKRAFWDVDMDKIDYQKNSLNVIERVMIRGTLDDAFEVERFYGKERVKKN
jgi:hypothetical protein